MNLACHLVILWLLSERYKNCWKIRANIFSFDLLGQKLSIIPRLVATLSTKNWTLWHVLFLSKARDIFFSFVSRILDTLIFPENNFLCCTKPVKRKKCKFQKLELVLFRSGCHFVIYYLSLPEFFFCSVSLINLFYCNDNIFSSVCHP